MYMPQQKAFSLNLTTIDEQRKVQDDNCQNDVNSVQGIYVLAIVTVCNTFYDYQTVKLTIKIMQVILIPTTTGKNYDSKNNK